MNRDFALLHWHDQRFTHDIVRIATVIFLCGGLPAVVAAQDQVPDAVPQSTVRIPVGQLIDLTHPFNEKTLYWPTADAFRLQVVAAGRTERGYFYAANRFAAAEHGGTHVDAPRHFSEKGETVDSIPLERLMGEAVLIDVTRQCAKDSDYQIGVADLRNWEEKHKRQLVDVIVLLRTGYSQFWPDARRYLGTEERGADAVAKLHFPGLHPDAARWLVEHRQVKAIGIDTASIDHGQSRTFGSHVMLSEHHVPAFENVAELHRLPEVGFQVIALPMKIGGGSGAPLRIVAIVPEQQAK
jgi:kynurenine formamidase